MAIVQLTAETFDQVIDTNELVVIDFWSKWCQSCKQFSKTFETVAAMYPEVVFASIDVEAEQSLVEDFNIRSIPTVMILRQRIAVFVESGALDKEVLIDLLAQAKQLDMQAIMVQLAQLN